MNLVQSLRLKLLGKVYLEHRTRPGWTGPLPFYLVKCPTHGLFENYPHGYRGYFTCPECVKEYQASRPDASITIEEGVETVA